MRCVAVLSLALFALAGCSGGGTTSVGVPCPALAFADVQAKLVAPAPGATGVSPSIGAITFSYTNPSLPSASFTLTPSDGSPPVFSGSAVTPVTVVPGTATVTIPTLKAATTYHVTGSTVNMAHLSCFAPVTADLGSFTTQ
jgi:hypothetical protein